MVVIIRLFRGRGNRDGKSDRDYDHDADFRNGSIYAGTFRQSGWRYFHEGSGCRCRLGR